MMTYEDLKKIALSIVSIFLITVALSGCGITNNGQVYDEDTARVSLELKGNF